jgi:hypothetical protein
MTEKRYLLGFVSIFAFGAAIAFAGDWAAHFTGSHWIFLPLGLIGWLGINRLFEPFFVRAIKAGYRAPYKRSDFSMRMRLLTFAAFLGLLGFELWRGVSSAGPVFVGILLGMTLSPMPHDPEAFADE